MPTSRPRHTITETDELAHALDDAARHWPQEADARGRLLLHLVHEGHRAIGDANSEESQRRRDAVERTAGELTGVYPADYLERLRDDWPA
jgi:hypothetical protein